MERNPFYWAVDTAGNQLPYLDRISHGPGGEPGGSHNALTRIHMKPTNMIGSYAQLSLKSITMGQQVVSGNCLSSFEDLVRLLQNEDQGSDCHGHELGQMHWMSYL
jgi:hypothetical protein